MSDAQRAVRYLVPGALAELLFGLWLYFDLGLCGCYGAALRIDGPALAVVLVGFPLPLGFVASNLTAEVTWRVPWMFNSFDNARFLETFGYVEEADAIGRNADETISDLGRSAERDEALVNLLLRHGDTESDRARVLTRFESLLDISHSLGNAAIATMIALVAMVSTLVVTSATQQGAALDGERLLLAGCAGLIMGLVLVSFTSSQRRVSTIATHYLYELFRLNEKDVG